MPVFAARSQCAARKERCGHPHSLPICHGWNRASSEKVGHGGRSTFGISILRAITVEPGTANSIKLEDIAPPQAGGGLLVRALALGVCGTDRDIIDGHYGWAPPGASSPSRLMTSVP